MDGFVSDGSVNSRNDIRQHLVQVLTQWRRYIYTSLAGNQCFLGVITDVYKTISDV